jgi:acetyl esterase/lipase
MGRELHLEKNIQARYNFLLYFWRVMKWNKGKTGNQSKGLKRNTVIIDSLKSGMLHPVSTFGKIFSSGHLVIFPLLVLSLLLTTGCKDEEEDPPPQGPLNFSSSPINLANIEARFVANYPYGTKERNVFDIWLPVTSEPTPLVIYVHGGGFTSGDKSFVHTGDSGHNSTYPQDIRVLLSEGVAFAAINYTLLLSQNEDVGVDKCLMDITRAIQFLRSEHELFNIDPERIALAGNSAGAGASLWVATSDEMADPTSEDPVLQESTRVSAVVLIETQSTYDLQRWFSDVFDEYNFSLATFEDEENLFKSMKQLYGIATIPEFYDEETVAYRLRVDMLSRMSSDDPPLWIENDNVIVELPTTMSALNHHAFHARMLKQRADDLGIENVAYYGPDAELFSDPSNEFWVDFVLRILNEE